MFDFANEREQQSTDLQLAVDLDVDVLEEAQIQLLANDVLLALLQVQQTAVVGLLDRREEVVADVVAVMLGRADRDLLAVLLDGIAPVVLGRLRLAMAGTVVLAVAPSRGQRVDRGNGIVLNGNGRGRGQAGGNGEEEGERLHGGGAKVLGEKLG